MISKSCMMALSALCMAIVIANAKESRMANNLSSMDETLMSMHDSMFDLSSFQSDMVKGHNMYRTKMDLVSLMWSEELYKFAKINLIKDDTSNSCMNYPTSSMNRSKVGYFEHVGENLYLTEKSVPSTQRVIDSWYSEIECYRYGPYGAECTNKCNKKIKSVNHFVQMMSAQITHVGCYMHKCNNVNRYNVACYYGSSISPFAEMIPGSYPFSMEVAKRLNIEICPKSLHLNEMSSVLPQSTMEVPMQSLNMPSVLPESRMDVPIQYSNMQFKTVQLQQQMLHENVQVLQQLLEQSKSLLHMNQVVDHSTVNPIMYYIYENISSLSKLINNNVQALEKTTINANNDINVELCLERNIRYLTFMVKRNSDILQSTSKNLNEKNLDYFKMVLETTVMHLQHLLEQNIQSYNIHRIVQSSKYLPLEKYSMALTNDMGVEHLRSNLSIPNIFEKQIFNVQRQLMNSNTKILKQMIVNNQEMIQLIMSYTMQSDENVLRCNEQVKSLCENNITIIEQLMTENMDLVKEMANSEVSIDLLELINQQLQKNSLIIKKMFMKNLKSLYTIMESNFTMTQQLMSSHIYAIRQLFQRSLQTMKHFIYQNTQVLSISNIFQYIDIANLYQPPISVLPKFPFVEYIQNIGSPSMSESPMINTIEM